MNNTSVNAFTPEQATIVFNATIKNFKKEDSRSSTVLCDISEDLTSNLRDIFNSLLDLGAKIEEGLCQQVWAFNLFGNVLADINLMQKLIPMCNMAFFEKIISRDVTVPDDICLYLKVEPEIGEVLVNKLIHKSKLNATIAYAKAFGLTSTISDAINMKLENKEADTFLIATAYGDSNLAKKALDAVLTEDGQYLNHSDGFWWVLQDALYERNTEITSLLLTSGVISPEEVYLGGDLCTNISICNEEMVNILLKFNPMITLDEYQKNKIMEEGSLEAKQLLSRLFPEATSE